MSVFRVAAADKGVKRGDAVHQAVFQQEIQGAVHRRRRGAAAVFVAQHAKNVVGAQRFVAGPDQLQHAFTQGGQAQPLARADAFRLGQSMADAMRMVVLA